MNGSEPQIEKNGKFGRFCPTTFPGIASLGPLYILM